MSERELIDQDIDAYLVRHEHKELLRFVAVGSVDDGKSTLIGRLLHDTHGIYEDQLSAVKRASKQALAGEEIDFSLFTDGLKAEREQGITIDVAYRYFSTEKRKFIIADTPGHVQYTRNMATGASTAQVGLILIDARLGVLQQSRRHAYIAALLGIPHLAVCVNKMDLVDFDRAVYEKIRAEFQAFAEKLGFTGITFIPLSALKGDNVVHRSLRGPWYTGPTLLEHLESVPLPETRSGDSFRYPVQYVLRPNLDYRAFAAQIASGSVKKGDPIVVLPSGKTSRVVAIDTFDGELTEGHWPMSVALRLEHELDVSRGDMLVHPNDRPRVGRRFEAMLVWMSERPLDPQKSYFLKHTTQYVRAEIERIAHTVDLETLEPVAAARLDLNDIGRVTIACHRAIYYDAYAKSRSTGSFVLIDSITNNTVAAGMILDSDAATSALGEGESAERSHVSPLERRERLGQTGFVVWLTGLPASGKTRLAFALERLLFDRGFAATVVDPDDGWAHGATPDPTLGGRFADAGLIAIFAFDSPRRDDRDTARDRIGANRFVEILVATPLDVCKKRDTSGRLSNNVAHEPPSSPDLVVSSETDDADTLAERIFSELEKRRLV